MQWVLLTDFQELRLFDVTIRPNKRNLEAGLRMDLTYDPYLFDVIGVEVLGNIYEQYLGFVPRLTEKRVK